MITFSEFQEHRSNMSEDIGAIYGDMIQAELDKIIRANLGNTSRFIHIFLKDVVVPSAITTESKQLAVAEYVQDMLQAAGYLVQLYVSPSWREPEQEKIYACVTLRQ